MFSSKEAQALDFAPDIVQLQEAPPSPLPRTLFYLLSSLFLGTIAWACIARLDIIAVAEGKLVPENYLQIVQPAEAGIVREILVRDGAGVEAGQVLVRMDARVADADRATLAKDIEFRELQLRRIESELSGGAFRARSGAAPDMLTMVEQQLADRKRAYRDSLAQEHAQLEKLKQDLAAAMEISSKLSRTAPIYREQAAAWDRLAKEGFAGRLLALERERVRIENEQDTRSQERTIEGLRASIRQSEERINQVTSNYRSQLQSERVDAEAQLHRLKQELEKQARRSELLELRAPQAGVVKDLGTYTVGAVVQPGAVLMTLVPSNDALQAEVWVSNSDAGFVQANQEAQIKVQTFPFQKYGMVQGVVRRISPDTADAAKGSNEGPKPEVQQSFAYRTVIVLDKPHIEREGQQHALLPGMRVTAEINLGSRTVLEFLLSPIQKVAHEDARER
jgi:HlyD family secretion protein